LDSNKSKDVEKASKKPSNRIKILIPLIIILATLAVFFYIKMGDTPKKSKVDGVSDEVYEQLVQFYFYTIKYMELIEDGNLDSEWMKDNEDLYEQAEKYAENHEDVTSLHHVFPNPLYQEYSINPDAYSEKEKEYIERMSEFTRAFQRIDVEEYEVLKKEVKEELHIKDSYNPFD